MTESPWLTVAEAAGRARCHRDTVLNALRSEKLRGYQAVAPKGTWRIHEDDLDAWVRGEVADVQVPSTTRRRAS